jgi:hypothetical protein
MPSGSLAVDVGKTSKSVNQNFVEPAIEKQAGVVNAVRSDTVITAAILERCLDRIAQAIVKDKKRGEAYLPIYERLDAELKNLASQEIKMAEIRKRVRQSTDRNRMQ